MTEINKERIEAAARAICRQRGEDPDEIVLSTDCPPVCRFARWTLYEDDARAALLADAPEIAAAEARGRMAELQHLRDGMVFASLKSPRAEQFVAILDARINALKEAANV